MAGTPARGAHIRSMLGTGRVCSGIHSGDVNWLTSATPRLTAQTRDRRRLKPRRGMTYQPGEMPWVGRVHGQARGRDMDAVPNLSPRAIRGQLTASSAPAKPGAPAAPIRKCEAVAKVRLYSA